MPSNARKYRSATAHRVAKQKAAAAAAASAASSPILSPRKPSFECPFCWELKIPTSISRKADLKRHFKQFHQNNAQWICQERGCSMAYDWKSAFEAHLKESHGNSQHPSESHQVKLCPQVVFACGFSNCRLVFEADSDEEAEKKAQEYFNHVANHFDDNLTHRNWSFSVRIRNLMRQAAVEPHWKDRKKVSQDPMWQPHTSSVVKKILETRHFTDIALLVRWVVNLGSFAYNQPHSPLPKLPPELQLPAKDKCRLDIKGHNTSLRRESLRHLPNDHPVKQEPQEPAVNQNSLPEPEPDMEAEFSHPVLTQHPNHGLPLQDYDGEQAYISYQPPPGLLHDQLMGSQVHASSSHADSTPTSFVDSWLAITEPRQDVALQSHLDAIMSYQHHQGHHQANPLHHAMLATSDFRPVTPGHQLLPPETYTTTTMMPNAMVPVDLEMNDCPYESDAV